MQKKVKNILAVAIIGAGAGIFIYKLKGGCLGTCSTEHVAKVEEAAPVAAEPVAVVVPDSLDQAKDKFKAAEILYLKARNNDETARDTLKADAHAGNYAAKMYLAFLHRVGSKGFPASQENAHALFVEIKDEIQKWAVAGIAEAQNALGLMHADELGGLPKDEKEAFRLFSLSALQGHVLGQNDLACAYYNGVGVKKNFKEAFKNYKLAADQGSAVAQTNVGWMYEEGLGVKKNLKEAVKYYKFSADQGHAWGESNLGRMYRDGLGGLPKDDKEAVRLFILSAEHGNAFGQKNLGNMYAEGRGGLPKDEKEAVKYYKLSADQGNHEGQIYLAEAYEKGLGGLPKDTAEAIKLYKLATEGENASVRKVAAKRLKKLSAKASAA